MVCQKFWYLDRGNIRKYVLLDPEYRAFAHAECCYTAFPPDNFFIPVGKPAAGGGLFMKTFPIEGRLGRTFPAAVSIYQNS